MSHPNLPRNQPHDLDTEQAVLGAILLDPSMLVRAQEFLTANEFCSSRHQQIFQAMVNLFNRGESPDLLTLGDALDAEGQLVTIGGRATLAELMTVIASPTNIEQHARIVRDHATRRRLIALSYDLGQRAYRSAPVVPLLEQAQRELVNLSTGEGGRGWKSLAQVTQDTIEHVECLSKRGPALIGVPTGFRVLDELFGGWQRSDLVIIAARPSMGKTSLALGAAIAAAESGRSVGVLSLEMPEKQLGLRLHGIHGSLNVHALRTGQLGADGWRRLADAAQRLEQLPLWIDDASMQTVEQVAAKSRKLKSQHGLELLILDYLQLLQTPQAENRQHGIADASRRLKLLAKELDVPILVLSQLSRAAVQREDWRPQLSDLRDSGAIEQDADIVLFIHREEVLNPDTDEKGYAEILARKHRNGPIGDRRLRFVEEFARFEDLAL